MISYDYIIYIYYYILYYYIQRTVRSAVISYNLYLEKKRIVLTKVKSAACMKRTNPRAIPLSQCCHICNRLFRDWTVMPRQEASE